MKHRFKTFIVSAFLLTSAVTGSAQQALPVYLDESKSVEQRIDDALSRMTLDEKIAVIHAQSKFSSRGIPRLGFPDFWTDDGPHGVRPDVLWDEWEQAGQTNDSCVAFPALTCLAASWNPQMAQLYGKSLGEEALYRGKDMILGPGVNIYRTPLGGRNFEYMGEDPFLTSTMVVPYIIGLQSNGVSACVKHLLKDLLKGKWGFDGVVVSDWGGTHNTDQAVHNGLDMEFGSWTNGLSEGASNAYDSYYLANPYKKGILSGKYSMDELNDKVRRVLRLYYRTTMAKRGHGLLCSESHYDAAKRIGEDGIVLLKNDGGVLPIDVDGLNRPIRPNGHNMPNKPNKPNMPNKPNKPTTPTAKPTVLVVGENAIKMMTVGGGSSSLKVQKEISPLDGLKARLAGKATVEYERGYVGDVTGNYNGVTTGQDLSDNRSEQQLIDDAVAKARKADYVIVFGGLNKSDYQDCEGHDRKQYGLPYAQDKLIEALAKANKKLVYVNISGNAVAMPWKNQVSAIVQGWFLGSEAGEALAAVLCGDANPSGKLPFTWPASLKDVGAHALDAYPGTWRKPGGAQTDGNIIDETYKEGIYVGYRWADAHKTHPLFAFGHGLSYSSFNISNLRLSKSAMTANDSLTVTVSVKNTGKRAGAEVVQLYIHDDKASVDRPYKELKGFKKIYLEPGQSADVAIAI